MTEILLKVALNTINIVMNDVLHSKTYMYPMYKKYLSMSYFKTGSILSFE